MPESKDIKRLQKISVFKKYLPIFKKQVSDVKLNLKEIIKLGGTPVEDRSNKGSYNFFNLKTYLFIRI
jgi:hypothetical protein